MIYERENMIESLSDRWDTLMRGFMGSSKMGYPTMNHIIDAYSHPNRKYHNLKHISNMFEVFDDVSHLLQNPLAVGLAIFYHDFIYNPRARDNEDNSSKAIIPTIGDFLSFSKIGDAIRLIMATSHHRDVTYKGDERYIVDLDLAILGSDPSMYDAYKNGIREEYGHINTQLYRHGRRSFLLQMLDKEHIYNTQVMCQRFEKQAVENISNEIKELKNENS